MKNFLSDFFDNKTKTFLTLLLIPLILYKKALFFGFSPMDEQWLIEDNSTFLADWESLKRAFIEPSAFVFYRPLFMISLIIDYHIGKLDPFFYHFSNLVFHLVNVLLVFKFLTGFAVKNKTAFGLALLFAVHPLMLHTVAWIPGRNDSLLCLFVLSSLIFLQKYFSENKRAHFILHLLFFICALLTKENAIVLPFIFILLYSTKKENKKELGLFSLAWFVIALVWFMWRRSVTYYIPAMEGDFIMGLKNIVFAFLVFIGKTLFPFQQSVFPTLKNSSLIPGVIALLLFVFAWFTGRPKNKELAFLGLFIFFGVLIIPVFYGVLKSPGEQYEHRIYTSMAGFLLFLSQLESRIKPKTLTVIFVLIIGLLSARTYVRMDIYKDKLSFLDAGIKESPEYYYFYLAKGDALYKNKDYAGALVNFDKAIELFPLRPQSYNNRANAYVALGRYKEAIADYTKALDKTGTNAAVLMQRCIAYYSSGDLENAIADLNTLKKCCQSQVHPDMEKTLNEKWEIEKWNRKISADPKNAALYVERAGFFMEKRMGKEALADLQKACELEPQNKVYKRYLHELSTSFPH